MIVVNNEYLEYLCLNCYEPYEPYDKIYKWCTIGCNAKQEVSIRNSGNKYHNVFIKELQSNTQSEKWIPYNRLINIEYFNSNLYKAILLDEECSYEVILIISNHNNKYVDLSGLKMV